MTDAEFHAWCLRDGAQRTILVELDYRYESAGVATTGTLYLSNRPYVDNVTPRAYDECVKSVPDYERTLVGASLNSYQVSFGTLEIANPDGEHDFLLPSPVDGSEVRFYAGDESWPVADFKLIFACMQSRIEAPALDRITVYLKDASLLINKSIGGEVKVGGDGPNADRWRPVPFGVVNQAPCLAQDDATLTYIFADSYDIIVNDDGVQVMTVRDRGVPIDYNDNSDGAISLLAAPDGEITCDITAAAGDYAGNRCVSDAVDYFIGDRAGLNALSRYDGPGATYDTRPATGIAAWVDAGGEDYLIGILLTDSRNAIDLLNALTDSGNCSWACTRMGNLTLGRLRPFDIASLGVTAKRSIVEDDIDDGTLRITHAAPTHYRLQCLGSKNWTIVTDLAGVLTPEERAHLTRPGLYKIQDLYFGDTYLESPQSYHRSMSESAQIDTLISGLNDSIDTVRQELWMGVRRNMLLPWLETVTLRTGMDRYDHEIFDVVPIDFTKSGRALFSPALDTQITRIRISLTSWEIELGLFHRRIAAAETGTPDSEPEPDPGTPSIPQEGFGSCSLNPVPCILTGIFNPLCMLEINCGGPGEGDWSVHDGTGELVALTMVYGRDITYNAVYWSDLVAYDADAGLQGYMVSFGNSVTPPANPATDLYWLYTVTAPGYSVPTDVYVGDIANRAGVMTVWEPLTDLPGLVNGGSYVFYLWWGLDPSGMLLNGDTSADPPWGAPPAVRPFSHSFITLQAYLTADNSPFGPPIVFTEASA